jgi:hypothetical protein
MSDETVVKMRILGPTDTPAVSTILEEMFQFFDGSVRSRASYASMERHVRLRLALLVFGDLGFARLDITKPKPMLVPTAKLLKLLEVGSVTTDVEPLVLRPIQKCISQPEASRQTQYPQALKSAMAKKMAAFLRLVGATLQMWEMGWLRHSRASNGNLVWSNAGEADETGRLPPGDARQSQPALMKAAEVEFEIDDENMLLVRGDDLPLESEVLKLLEVSHKELRALFKTAAKLLAETKPEDRMRAYAARDCCGEWQVELLRP